ncbi:UBX domain-containing protein 1 [Cichlidogyrus casuarinus]|uniref:UBX domain-containing protein 1 n=1 Tax=Cichlidogyrus casuarinus TaxID=1844966 RepID=A0ABD2QC00_9PLAT
MSDEALIKSIMEMGFPEFKAKKALKATKATNIEQAIEWLIKNSDRITEDDDSDDNSDKELEPSSFKCDEYTGHVRFSESTEEVKPLTEEEKQEQKRLLEEKLKVKKHEREEREKQDELEAEKRRREQGKVISTAKEEFQHIEMKRFMEEQRRQKEEDRRYK